MADIFRTSELPKFNRTPAKEIKAGSRIVYSEPNGLKWSYYPKLVLEVTQYSYAPITKLVLAERGGEAEKPIYYHHNDTLSVYVEDDQ